VGVVLVVTVAGAAALFLQLAVGLRHREAEFILCFLV